MGCSCSKEPEPRSEHGPTLLSSVPKQRTRAQKGQKIRVSCHASEGSKWHLELLAVSEDLQKQLQDPQFVATRCDLDGSGDLDPHELRQAARVYGIDPDPGTWWHFNHRDDLRSEPWIDMDRPKFWCAKAGKEAARS